MKCNTSIIEIKYMPLRENVLYMVCVPLSVYMRGGVYIRVCGCMQFFHVRMSDVLLYLSLFIFSLEKVSP